MLDSVLEELNSELKAHKVRIEKRYEVKDQLVAIDQKQMKKALRPYLLPRLGRPSDPAALVVFLASDLAGWITAQTYPVNGGYSPAL